MFQQLNLFYWTGFCLKNNKFFQLFKTLKENCQKENSLQVLRKNRVIELDMTKIIDIWYLLGKYEGNMIDRNRLCKM